ncbi:MAG: choice-of-anchor I family protein [Anaerolineales bacterium]|nr:choice-of-anchor I family protein [Anaerolineales bacterium]
MFRQNAKRVSLLIGLITLNIGLILSVMQWQTINAQTAVVPDVFNEFTIDPTYEYTLSPVGNYQTGIFDEGAAEIVAHDPVSQNLYVVNGASVTVDILSIGNAGDLTLSRQIPITMYGGTNLNSLAFQDGVLAVAAEIEANDVHSRGLVIFFDRQDTVLATAEVGYLPDMVTFTPDGTKVIVANEGEPSPDYTFDPEGSISIVDISGGVATITSSNVTEINFTDFNEGGSRHAELDPSIRIYGPGASVAQDLEPEYIAVSPDSATAYVTLQENNALAVIDLNTNTLTALVPLGTKDHSLRRNAFDPSDDDGGIMIASWPVYGMYQPDSIVTYSTTNGVYLLTANEGDARDYDGYSEEERMADLTLDPTVYPLADILQQDQYLGRLRTTSATGDTDGDGDVDQLYSYGARSFSIWAADGSLVYDSGSEFEQLLAITDPAHFNSNNDDNDSFDNRSDDKGPEPEALAIGEVDGRMFAFIGFERMGGIVIYDITDPTQPFIVSYFNYRNFAVDAEDTATIDLGPEGFKFITAAESPLGEPLIAVANEVSGSTSLYRFTQPTPRAFIPVVLQATAP